MFGYGNCWFWGERSKHLLRLWNTLSSLLPLQPTYRFSHPLLFLLGCKILPAKPYKTKHLKHYFSLSQWEDCNTTDPTRLWLIWGVGKSSMDGVLKFIARRLFEISPERECWVDPSVTNTHCFFCSTSVYTFPTYTTYAAMSNSLK